MVFITQVGFNGMIWLLSVQALYSEFKSSLVAYYQFDHLGKLHNLHKLYKIVMRIKWDNAYKAFIWVWLFEKEKERERDQKNIN